jgi:hypothetical protein
MFLDTLAKGIARHPDKTQAGAGALPLAPIRRKNRGICGAETHMTAVTAFGSLLCSYNKGELLIHTANKCLLRPDAHQKGFLGLINFGSGLAIG